MDKSIYALPFVEGNSFLPPYITINDMGVVLHVPKTLGYQDYFVRYQEITAVMTNIPFIGYSGITFYFGGQQIKLHGFFAHQVKEIKSLVDSMSNIV